MCSEKCFVESFRTNFVIWIYGNPHSFRVLIIYRRNISPISKRQLMAKLLRTKVVGVRQNFGAIVSDPSFDIHKIGYKWWQITPENGSIAAQHKFVNNTSLIKLLNNCTTIYNARYTHESKQKINWLFSWDMNMKINIVYFWSEKYSIINIVGECRWMMGANVFGTFVYKIR